MNKYIFAVLCIGASLYCFGQNFSKIDFLADVNFMNTSLKFGHPENLELELKIDLSSSIEELSKNLPDSISKMEYENIVRKLLFEVGCIHTSVSGWGNSRSKKITPDIYFPFNIFCDGTKIWFVNPINDSLNYEIKRGNEIVSINTKTSKEIIEVLKYYHPVDGKSFEFNLNYINKEFPALYKKCIDQKNSFIVEYLDHNQILQIDTLKSISKKKLTSYINKSNVIIEGNDEFFFTVADSIGVLKIKSFASRSKKFYKKVFEHIKNSSISNLVVDVRDNLGGRRKNTELLISYLIDKECSYEIIRPNKNLKPYLKKGDKVKFLLSYMYYDFGNLFYRKKTKEGIIFTTKIIPNKNNFPIKKFVLVNGLSGSSASVLASYLKHHGNATIIGQQTGGGEFSNNGGCFPNLILPKSGLRIKTATYLMRYDIKGDNQNGIVPDYSINYDVNTFEIRDLELEKVLQLISSK
jgi:Peptidase family S41